MEMEIWDGHRQEEESKNLEKNILKREENNVSYFLSTSQSIIYIYKPRY